MTSIWVIPSNQDHTDEQAFHQITSKHCRKRLSLFEDSQRSARQIFVFRSNLSHSLKPYDQSMRGKLHANQPKKSSETSQNHQRLRNNGSDDCRLIQSTDTAHLQLLQSKPHSLAFCLGKMMLCGWWSPKACQDNGSNASTVPLNYCVCVSQRHYLT